MQDLEKATAEQEARWDDLAAVYTDVIIRKDLKDVTSQHYLNAIKQHGQLPEGSQILDTASSGGRPAISLAKALPHVKVISTDLSPKSVELARQHTSAAEVHNVTTQVADAQKLQSFDDDTFAVVTCALGLMHMPEHKRALSAAHRVLQPGGIYIATIWAEPARCQIKQVFGKMTQALTGSAPSPRPSPHGNPTVANAEDLQDELKEANFQDVSRSPCDYPLDMELADLVNMVAGPHGLFAPMLAKLKANGRSDVHQEAVQAITHVCKEQGWLQAGRVHLDNIVFMFTAVKPRLAT